MHRNVLREKFGAQEIWVNFRIVSRQGKKTKVPMSALDGHHASSTDERTWTTYDRCKANSANVGIVFTPERRLLGIDIDHCLDPKTLAIVHDRKDDIEELLRSADTYVEISPSGEGLHLFLTVDEPLDLEANRNGPFECYTSGRYFTVTENPLPGRDVDIRHVTKVEALGLLYGIGYPWRREEAEIPAARVTEDPSDRSDPLPFRGDGVSFLSDDEVVERMLSSANGSKIRSLYNGNGTGDESRDDLALCSYLAFWCGKDAAQMERIWTSSPMGARKKTQNRKDYRDRTLNAAIRSCRETYAPPMAKRMEVAVERAAEAAEEEDAEFELMHVVNRDGVKIYWQNTENMIRILEGHPEFRDRIKFDSFRNRISFRPFFKSSWRPLEEHDSVAVQTRISVVFPAFAKVEKGIVYDAMMVVAKRRQFDSAADFLRSLKWDGKSRLDTWLGSTYGCPGDEYHGAVAANWIKGMVKRILEPGCKFDYVLVLEGEQGSRKSTSLSVLGEMDDGSNWHVETTMSTDSKDFFMQFGGKAIIEFSEGETLSRTEVKKMKSIITTQSDKYRPPYDRVSQEFPRRCVFAMTTNETEYLKDDTGNRRWLPVTVEFPEADIPWLRENRDQILAEAYVRLVEGKETIYEFPADETQRRQADRRIEDVNAEVIVDWYHNRLTNDEKVAGITCRQVFRQALDSGGTYGKAFDKLEEIRIAGTLKSNLRLHKRRVREGSVQVTRWFPRGETLDTVLKAIREGLGPVAKDPPGNNIPEDVLAEFGDAIGKF